MEYPSGFCVEIYLKGLASLLMGFKSFNTALAQNRDGHSKQGRIRFPVKSHNGPMSAAGFDWRGVSELAGCCTTCAGLYVDLRRSIMGCGTSTLCARAKRDLQSLDARGERRWLNAEKLGRPASAIYSVIRSMQCGDQVFTLQVFHFHICHDFFLRTTIGYQRLFGDCIKLFSLFG